jgi:sulfatase modifying factor 1
MEINSPAQDNRLVPGSPPPGKPPAEGMVWIPGGTFVMGSDQHYPEEAPAHKVTVNGFWMDRYAVTNGDFRRFVEATRYVTFAERPANAADYPGAKPELLEPSAVVFRKTGGPVDLRNPHNWWTYVRGADWRHQQGPGSTLRLVLVRAELLPALPAGGAHGNRWIPRSATSDSAASCVS